jgi:hypothetical protein
VPIVLKSGSLKLLEPSGPVQASNGIALLPPLPVHIFHVYFPMWVKIGIRNLHIMILSINEFRENRRGGGGGGPIFVLGVT